MPLCARSTMTISAVVVSFVTLVQSEALLLADCTADDYTIRCIGKGNISHLSLQNFTVKDTVQSFYMFGLSIDGGQSTVWQHLPALAFQRLPMFYIRVTDVSAESIDAEAFTDTNNTLRYLSLAGNRLRSIPVQSFRLLGNLTTLNLNNNRIQQLEKGCFQNMGKLKYLYLAYNSIFSIAEGSFKGLKHLLRVHLRANPLLSIAGFSDLISIHSIFLTECSVQAIRGPLFKVKTDAKQIFLSENNISDIHPSSFSFMNKTVRVKLDKNRLMTEQVCTSLWQPLTSLQFLYLSHNLMRSVSSYCFGNLSFLRHLFLDHNKISHIDANAFSGIVNLQELKLGYNGLQVIHTNSFFGLSNLKNLDLRNNQIETLEKDSFHHLNMLYYLGMVNNALRSLEGLCHSNGQNLTNLKILDLSRNDIESIPVGCFNNLVSLEHLFLDKNNISELETNVFKGMPVLDKLYLDHNRLLVVRNGVFNGLRSLRFLYLKENKIHTIEAGTFSALLVLKELGLQSNDLETLSPTMFPQDCITGCSIKLKIDSLICNCSLSWVTSQEQISNRSQIDCILPTDKNKVNVVGFINEHCSINTITHTALSYSEHSLVLAIVYMGLALMVVLAVGSIIIYFIHKRQSLLLSCGVQCCRITQQDRATSINSAQADTPC